MISKTVSFFSLCFVLFFLSTLGSTFKCVCCLLLSDNFRAKLLIVFAGWKYCVVAWCLVCENCPVDSQGIVLELVKTAQGTQAHWYLPYRRVRL